VVSVTDPYGRILGVLDRSRYFSIKYLLKFHTSRWIQPQTIHILDLDAERSTYHSCVLGHES
jgi:hypothetical protein